MRNTTCWLQDRVARLQELYMRDSEQRSTPSTVQENIQQKNLLQLATPELLAISQPPADFALPQHSRTMQIVPALHEIEALRRERDSAREQVSSIFLSSLHSIFSHNDGMQQLIDSPVALSGWEGVKTTPGCVLSVIRNCSDDHSFRLPAKIWAILLTWLLS